MDPAREGTYEAVPLQCFACAARDAEARVAAEMRGNQMMGAGSFDGLYFGVVDREVVTE